MKNTKTNSAETDGQDARATTGLAADFVEQYPGHREEMLAIQRKAAQARSAGAVPLPGPLREAFAGEPRVVCGLTLQPVNAWLLAILTRLESPLLDFIRIYREHAIELADPTDGAPVSDPARRKSIVAKIAAEIAAIKVPPEAVIETVFAFVTDVERCQELLDAGTFRKEARKAIGKKFHPAQLAKIERAIGEHFAASYATAIELEPERTDPGDGSFTTPPAPATTASAGGSKSSAP